MVTNNATNGEKLTGDTGTATGYPIKLSGTASGSSVSFSGSGSTVSLNLSDANSNIILGAAAGNPSVGSTNVAMGLLALGSSTASFDVAIGGRSLQNDTSGGGQNTAIGFFSMNANTTGSLNFALGPYAMNAANCSNDVAIGSLALANDVGGNNIGIGYSSLTSLTTGTGNLAIGYNSGTSYTGAETGNLLLLNIGTLGESNVTRIGTGQTKCFIAGIASVSVSNINMVTINTSTGQLGSATVPAGTVTSVSGTTNQVAVATGTTTPVISLVGPYTPATYTAHGVLIGEGTSSIVAASVGATGTVLAGSTGADPAFTATPTVTSITFGSGTALDTYVEGTFTPGVAFGGGTTGITYSTQTGAYRQIGGIVFFTIVLTLTNKGSSTGAATLTGMPVAGANVNSRAFVALTQNFTYTTNYTNLAWISAASTTFTLTQYSPSANQVNATDTNFANGTSFRFEGFYFV